MTFSFGFKIKFISILLFLCGFVYGGDPFEEGFASWYGGKFQGRLTANGEIFDTNQMTAAHKTLPFNTLVEVINLRNNKTTIVRINDRGPYVDGRIIDLSRAAADALDMVSHGVAPVEIRIHQEAPEIQFNLQVASYSIRDSAESLVSRLAENHVHAVIEASGTGFFRVIVPGVPASQIDQQKRILADLGFSDVLPKKIR